MKRVRGAMFLQSRCTAYFDAEVVLSHSIRGRVDLSEPKLTSTYCDFDDTYPSLISGRIPYKMTCLVTCAGISLRLGALVITVAIPIALAVAIAIAIGPAITITIAILISLAVTIAITVAIAIGLAMSTLPPWPTATVG